MPDGLIWIGLLHFMVDSLLLAGTWRLVGSRVKLLRLLLASGLSGIYAAGCLIPGFAFLGQLHWYLISLTLISVSAFGISKRGCKYGGMFVLLRLAVGGLAIALGSGDSMLLFCAVGIRLLSRFALEGGIGRKRLPVEIVRDGETYRFVALQDTGNELRDPISGGRVMVVSASLAEKMTGLSMEEIKDPINTITKRRSMGLRLIPYHGVGSEQGMLLAMRMKGVRIGDEIGTETVAFSPQEIGGEAYQALTGGV